MFGYHRPRLQGLHGKCQLRRVLLFLFCTVTLIVMVRVIEDAIPQTDPFDDRRPYRTQDFKGYGEQQISQMKIRHAVERKQPYDIGLFGNSRVLSVGREQLDVGVCTAFNFALSGQSFRSSVQLLESLAREQALPRLAVISIDHFELQMYANPWTGWRQRWSLLADDVAVAFRHRDVSLRDKMRVPWRFIWTETLLFQSQFEAAFFRRALLEALGLNDDPFPAAEPGGFGYLPDGSFHSPPRLTDDPPPFSRTTPQIINVILRNDLERLFRLARENNLELLIYESPLHPSSAAIFERKPSPFSESNRRTFMEACADFSVNCVAAPLEAFRETTGWNDASHPPPSVLGGWISAFSRPYLGGCAS